MFPLGWGDILSPLVIYWWDEFNPQSMTIFLWFLGVWGSSFLLSPWTLCFSFWLSVYPIVHAAHSSHSYPERWKLYSSSRFCESSCDPHPTQAPLPTRHPHTQLSTVVCLQQSGQRRDVCQRRPVGFVSVQLLIQVSFTFFAQTKTKLLCVQRYKAISCLMTFPLLEMPFYIYLVLVFKS